MKAFFRRLRRLPGELWGWIVRSVRALGHVTLAGVLRAAIIATLVVCALIVVGTFVLIHYPKSQIVERPGPDDLRWLAQGWSGEDRALYYYTPQGTTLKNLRYRWFVSLEMPWGKRRFVEPDHMRAYGFLVDPAASPANPDHLPVGFARRHDEEVRDDVLDFTCATCHTGQLDINRNGRRTSLRLDGGPGMHALTSVKLGHFGPVLLGSMASTYLNPFKFDRFARRVLQGSYSGDTKGRLKTDFRGVLLALLKQSVGDMRRGLYPTEEGYGRTDALGRIANTVFGDELDPANYRVANAPVSYPYLWNIWKFDWVQYNASVSQPMARNMGESLGVGATLHMMDPYGRPLPREQRFTSSVRVENLHRIETTLQKLTPPTWPEDVLGPIDRKKAEQGRQLFVQHCRGCHGPFPADDAYKKVQDPLRGPRDPLWRLEWLPVDDIGTDPHTAMNFAEHRMDLRRSGLTAEEVQGLVRPQLEEQLRRQVATLKESERAAALAKGRAAIDASLASIDVSRVSVGAALNYIGLALRQKHYEDRRYTPAEQDCLNGFGALDVPQTIAAYKPRPLAGTWATGPFLHNGSVPTLYQLLSPALERDSRFWVGGNDFDPVQVGIERAPRPGVNGFWYDTQVTGNSNVGHEFRAGYLPWKPGAMPQYGAIGPELTPDERWALVEYLKIHEDPATPPDRTPPTCLASDGGSAS